MITVAHAVPEDLEFLCQGDPKKPREAWKRQVEAGEVLVARVDGMALHAV